MNKKVAAVRSEQWRKIVFECINRDPSLSKRRWCENNGIKFRSLMYWQRKFQMEALDQVGNGRRELPASKEQTAPPAFVDVTEQLKSVPEEPKVLSSEQEPFIPVPELMIQAGTYRIYVNTSIHEDTLEKVLRVIRHA